MFEKARVRETLRGVLVELIVYGVLVILYVVLVLRFLAEPLADLYHGHLSLYAVASLVLIVVQAVVLESVTSFLVDRLRLWRFD